MFPLVFLYFIVPIALAETSVSCYTCATANLQERWQITGLPQLSSEYFTQNCNKLSEGDLIIPCEGKCFTYMFEDPDKHSKPLFIRGCHAKLTQIVLSPTRASSVENFCEHDDDYPLMNNRGERVKVKALVEFCNTTKCNNRELFDGCTGSPTNELINSQVLGCNECSPSEGRNCYKDEGKCSAKRYCTKQIVMLNHGYQLMKSCSDINLFGIDNRCMTYDIKSPIANVAVNTKYTQCYCRDKQFCNIAASPISLLSIFLAAMITFKL